MCYLCSRVWELDVCLAALMSGFAVCWMMLTWSSVSVRRVYRFNQLYLQFVCLHCRCWHIINLVCLETKCRKRDDKELVKKENSRGKRISRLQSDSSHWCRLECGLSPLMHGALLYKLSWRVLNVIYHSVENQHVCLSAEVAIAQKSC